MWRVECNRKDSKSNKNRTGTNEQTRNVAISRTHIYYNDEIEFHSTRKVILVVGKKNT